MGYNSARVIIGDQSEGRFITLSEASPKHRRCFAEQLGNIGDESPICRRCNADVSPMWMGHFWPRCTSLNVRRLLGAVQRYIADGIWRRNIGRKFECMHWNFSRCPDALAKHGDYSRTSPIIRRTSGAWWRCSGDAQICASREHREA